MADKKNKKGGDAAGRIGAFVAGAAVATAAGAYFLYGPKGAENRKKIESWSLKAKADVLARLEKLKEVSEEKYHEIVDTVTTKYAKMKDVGEEKAEKLNKELKGHWRRIKSDTKDTADKAKSTTRSVRKKLAKAIDPDTK